MYYFDDWQADVLIDATWEDQSWLVPDNNENRKYFSLMYFGYVYRISWEA